MATERGPDSSLSQDTSESSGEGSLELSYSSFGSGEEGEPEGVHPYLFEPTDSEDGGSADSDSSVDVSPRLLNLNW
jgi:hypothetical protein